MKFHKNRHNRSHNIEPPGNHPVMPGDAHHRGSEHGGHRWGRQLESGEKHLSECRAGDQISVQRVVGGGPVRRRLLEMGVFAGTMMRVVKYAPLKDPIECEVKGYHVALRVAEAQRIIVKPEKP